MTDKRAEIDGIIEYHFQQMFEELAGLGEEHHGIVQRMLNNFNVDEDFANMVAEGWFER
jgi:hypothetical protein